MYRDLAFRGGHEGRRRYLAPLLVDLPAGRFEGLQFLARELAAAAGDLDLERVLLLATDDDFVVEVRASGATGGADEADHLPLAHALALFHAFDIYVILVVHYWVRVHVIICVLLAYPLCSWIEDWRCVLRPSSSSDDYRHSF